MKQFYYQKSCFKLFHISTTLATGKVKWNNAVMALVSASSNHRISTGVELKMVNLPNILHWRYSLSGNDYLWMVNGVHEFGVALAKKILYVLGLRQF